jgi:hypothetical protein
LNEDGNGEVDENFSAQAAADQAVGRATSDGEGGTFYPSFPCHLTSMFLTSETSVMLAGDGRSIPFNSFTLTIIPRRL